MPDLIAASFSTLPAPAAGQDIPDWVHLLPAGTFRSNDGRGPYTLADPDGVIRASMEAGKLPIDENHSIDRATPKGQPSPARGWIVALESRSDGLWGHVEWNESGKALLADHAYRGMSPVFSFEGSSGRIRKVLRASLTNNPALDDLKSLHDRSHDAMDLDKLRAALGLAADADDAAIIAAATKGREAIAANTAHSADLARIATAAGLDAKEISADGLVTHLQTHSKDGDDLAKTVIALQTKLDTLEASRAKEAAERAVDAAIAAGKPVRGLRDHYIARHVKDPAGVDKELAGLPSLNDGGSNGRDPGNGGGAVEPVELATKAAAYQRKLAEAGQEIDFATAVCAVQEGKQ